MNARRQEQRKAKENLERMLMWVGKTCFFVFGYYTLSRVLVNWYLRTHTATGWQFGWDIFEFFASHIGFSKAA